MLSRFDVAALRGLAGEKVFARGKTYFEGGQVMLLESRPERVLAQVAGTDDYRTELTGSGEEIDGACSCPAFGDWGFCKHMVAVALAANAALPQPAAGEANMLARIRTHLAAQGVEALVAMIVGLAERDPALLRRLDMTAAAAQGDDDVAAARLRKALDAATHTGSYVEYREARGWARGVDEVLDTIAGLVPAGRPRIAFAATEYALDRIGDCMGAIDDSEGHCGALMHRARDIHLDAARAVRPEPVGLARSLFGRETEDPFDVFAGAAVAYADVLGDAGLAEYRRLASEAWERLPRFAQRDPKQRHIPSGDLTLKGILDFFAERDGDLDARIALRAAGLTSTWSYLSLAQFCEEHGRHEEALRWAEEGLWVFEDGRPDERLLFFVAAQLVGDGRAADALAQLWRAFSKAPSFELYLRLRQLGGDAARERALAMFEVAEGGSARGSAPRHADLLVRILLHEGLHGAAWAAVQRGGASRGLTVDLARASEATHPQEALRTYADHVDRLAELGGDPAYREAAGLVARMAAMRGAAEQAAYVAALKGRFGRRRNFMKLLG